MSQRSFVFVASILKEEYRTIRYPYQTGVKLYIPNIIRQKQIISDTVDKRMPTLDMFDIEGRFIPTSNRNTDNEDKEEEEDDNEKEKTTKPGYGIVVDAGL